MSKRTANAWLAGAAVLAVSVGGCSDQRAELQTAHRVERMQMWLDQAAAREADCPRRLAEMGELAGWSHRRDVARFNRIPAEIEAWHANDVRTWQRYIAWHGELAGKHLAGNPERAHRVAIDIVY